MTPHNTPSAESGCNAAVAPRQVAGPRRCGVWPLVAGVMFAALCGANCQQMVYHYTQPLPRALPAGPTLQQVMDVVNDNSNRVQSLYCTRGSVSTPGFPPLRANIAFQRNKNFRLRAETTITGPEVDLGSNEEQFWFWVRRAQPPTLFFCRHDRYSTSAARQVIPVEPEWIIAALGIVTFDSTWQHQGPFPVGSGRIEIRSTQPHTMSPDPVTRITVIDDTRGVVLEQHLYNQQGQRLATAKLSKHQHDMASSTTLPRHIEINWPATKFELAIDLTDLQINTLSAGSQQFFTRPQYPGFQDVDLADPNLRFGAATGERRVGQSARGCRLWPHPLCRPPVTRRCLSRDQSIRRRCRTMAE